MKVNPITLILIAALLYPLIRGFIMEFSSNNLKDELLNIEGDISFILSLILSLYFSRKIFVQHDETLYKNIYKAMPQIVISYVEKQPSLVYIVILPIFIFIIYQLLRVFFYLFNAISFFPILDKIESGLRSKSRFVKRVMGALFEAPKSISYILFITFLLNILSILDLNNALNNNLSKSMLYNTLCKNVVIPITNSGIAKQLPNIINNSFRVVEVKHDEPDSTANSATGNTAARNTRTIVYYNGVTLDEGVKSDNQINDFAKKLVENQNTSKLKARKLYDWIGANIDYDQDKAQKVMNNDFSVQSGAIPTFNTRIGICFDYSCLYVAMCRAVGLHVRLVTGEGFNGISWVSHAWNQVYSTEDKKWLNVDTTFYKGGNYFNTNRFDIDHRNANIVGEW